MKILKIFILLLILAFVSFGQKANNDTPKFDIADFNEKSKVAEWLVEYDLVAWKTTDELMKQDQKEIEKLGAEWFCFQDKNGLWHAVYGKYENEKYDLVFDFTMDKNSKITRTTEKIDAEFLNSHSKALVKANQQLKVALKDDAGSAF